MESVERQQLTRRISNRKLYATISFEGQEIPVIFSDPSLPILSEADSIYINTFNNYKGELYTLDESYNILIDKGLWSNELEAEYNQISKDIDSLNVQLPKSKFHKAQQRVIKATIEKGKKRLDKLHSIKNQLWSSTLEALCTKIKRHFLIQKITQVEAIELLKNNRFLNLLSVYYFEESSIPTEKIRELARTDPWRLYWTVSKDTGTSLFPHSCVEMTEYQYLLALWSKVYDVAYESSERPTDDVINDDTLFDAWYDEFSQKIQNELRKNQVENQLGVSGSGGQEMFIPADEEGAKEVYKLNNLDAQNRVRMREKALAEKGELKEYELPDIRMDLKVEANKVASESIKKRR